MRVTCDVDCDGGRVPMTVAVAEREGLDSLEPQRAVKAYVGDLASAFSSSTSEGRFLPSREFAAYELSTLTLCQMQRAQNRR